LLRFAYTQTTSIDVHSACADAATVFRRRPLPSSLFRQRLQSLAAALATDQSSDARATSRRAMMLIYKMRRDRTRGIVRDSCARHDNVRRVMTRAVSAVRPNDHYGCDRLDSAKCSTHVGYPRQAKGDRATTRACKLSVAYFRQLMHACDGFTTVKCMRTAQRTRAHKTRRRQKRRSQRCRQHRFDNLMTVKQLAVPQVPSCAHDDVITAARRLRR
jgi:hypothetical protein